MNPLKPLLDSFDRLINERGSANILRERLALAADQYTFLEQKLVVYEKENSELKSKIQFLEARSRDIQKENDRLKFDNEQLKKKIQEYEEGSFGPNLVVPFDGIDK